MGERTLERRIVTVLFADLVGFTTLSESLDPEDVVTVQDAYFAAVRETVARHGGRLEKFIGDAAVAVFGLPRAREDDAERAVRAGLALAAAVDQLGARLGVGAGELQVRVGVNTGEVAYAEGGPERGPVTGDTVNVASRLQTAAPPGGVLVGEATALAVAAGIELGEPAALALKGKAEPTRVWHAVAVRPDPSREHAMGLLRAPMLGRDAELRALRTARAAAQREAPIRTILVAPPGVGKTRLVSEFAAEVSGAALVLRGRLRPDVLGPYDAVAQLLVGALVGSGLHGDNVTRDAASAVLERCLGAAVLPPGRAAVVAQAALAVVWPDDTAQTALEDRDAVFAAWLEAFDALASGRPQLWIVEDVHWAGGDLLAFIAAAGSAPASGGRLVVATSRPAVLETAREWVDGAELLSISGLSGGDVRALVSRLVGDALPAALLERVAAASDGNPLFVEEVLRSWISAGVLVDEDGGWRLTAPAADVAVPTTVQAVYASQLDDLPAPARLTARRASVPGRRFPAHVLGPLGIDDAAAGIEPLARRALVGGPVPDALFGPTYAFRHALLRDAGYASLARAERAELHVRVAEWLEQTAGERRAQLAEVIGRHYAAALANLPALAGEAAGRPREQLGTTAADWFERAALVALGVAAQDSAQELLRRSLEHTAAEQPLDEARRGRLLGETLGESGDMREAVAALERARQVAADLVDASPSPTVAEAAYREYARATASLGRVFNEQVLFARAEEVAEEALQRYGERDDAETARLLLLRGTAVGYGTDDDARAAADVRRAADLARRAGDQDVEIDALVGLGRLELDDGAAAVGRLRAIENACVEAGRWAQAATTARTAALLLVDRAASKAAEALDRAEEYAGARGLLEELAWVDYARAELAFLRGEWDDAVAAALRAVELAERYGYRRVGIRSWYVLVPIASARGDTDLLRGAFDFSLRERPSFPTEPAPWARVMSTAADLHFEAAGWERTARYAPNDDAALPAFDAFEGVPSWYAAAETVVASWLRAGSLGRASEALRRVDADLARTADPAPLCLGVGALLDARLKLASGAAGNNALESLPRAEDAFRRAGAPWWLARTLRLLEERGGAAELAAEAGAIERRLGTTAEVPSATL